MSQSNLRDGPWAKRMDVNVPTFYYLFMHNHMLMNMDVHMLMAWSSQHLDQQMRYIGTFTPRTVFVCDADGIASNRSWALSGLHLNAHLWTVAQPAQAARELAGPMRSLFAAP